MRLGIRKEEMMIRKEIKIDGTLGGNYPYGIEYPQLPETLIEIDEEKAFEIDQNITKYKYINGEITDISETEEYKASIISHEKEMTKCKLRLEVEELDIKRIRALAEPELKDAESGQTWLEFYTEQIQSIRAEIARV